MERSTISGLLINIRNFLIIVVENFSLYSSFCEPLIYYEFQWNYETWQQSSPECCKQWNLLMWIAVGVCLFFIILVVFICGDLKHSNILINWEGGHQRFINVKIPRISFYDYTAYEEHLSIFRSIRLISPWSMPVLFGYFLWSTRHFSL